MSLKLRFFDIRNIYQIKPIIFDKDHVHLSNYLYKYRKLISILILICIHHKSFHTYLDLIKVLPIASIHILRTLPSIVYHGLLRKYYRLTYPTLTNCILTNKHIIMFVHGRGGHSNDFIPLIENLKPLVSDEYHFKTIDLGDTRTTSVDEEAHKIKEVLALYIDCQITLIGLSKGGLDILYYINNIPDKRIRAAITISSPLKGTKITSVLPEDSITHKELGFQSDLTTKLYNKEYKIPVYHVVPKWDHMIIPTSSAGYVHTNPSHIYYYNGSYSHTGIIYDIDIAKTISKWLPKL